MAAHQNKKRQAEKEAGITCLVTGFDPFFGEPFNPSEIIAESMPSELLLVNGKIKVPVKHLTLPVIGTKCWQLVSKTVEDLKQQKQGCFLIMLGLASKRGSINLERFALNIRDDTRPDNQNHLVRNQTIVKGAPEAFRTDVPIEDTLDHLNKKGWPAQISNHAATFICNEIYFHALNTFQGRTKKSRLPYKAIFVHVPLPGSYGKTLKEKGTTKTKAYARGKKNQMAAMVEAVKTIAEFNCELLIKQMG
jgi:pyroglutamyl-peptidase